MLEGEALWNWKSDCGAGLHFFFFFFFKVLTTKVFIPELERPKPSSLAPVTAAALVGVGAQGKVAYTTTPQQTHILHNWGSRSTMVYLRYKIIPIHT